MRAPTLLLLAASTAAAQTTGPAPTSAALPLRPVATARQTAAPAQILPVPAQATFPAGRLPLAGLGLEVRGADPALGNAARDLRAEWRTRLGATLADGGARRIVVGTLADADLRARAQKAGLLNTKPEGYALWVDAEGAFVVGADAAGAYFGAQTLRQLLTPEGLRFARISDAPALGRRIAMLYLDQYSNPVNDRLIPLLARMKYNAVLVMSNYVQWDTAKKLGFVHPGGATKAEAARVAALARSYGLEPIPLVETLGHVGWMFHGGANRDLMQDPQSQNPFAYDTLNPRTYDEVILPVLGEAIEVFKPKKVHIGHDEVRNVDRFPARENGKAVGFEKLFVDDTLKLHGFLKARGVGTMLWHDVAFADAFRDKIPPALPKDIEVAYWNYTPGADYPLLDVIRRAGFPTLGAAWREPNNPEQFARSALKYGVAGLIQTRWSGYFGNPSIWDGQAEQGTAYVRGGAAAWNPNGAALADPAARFRDFYAPQAYTAEPGRLVDLSSRATRALTDADEKGWIQKGPGTDLSALPRGEARLGAWTFHVSGAVMTKGSRAAASDLPARVDLPLNAKATALAFLHTTGWGSPTDRDTVGRYEIAFEDGTTLVQPLEYGRHVAAWTERVTSSLVQEGAWRGQTKDGLDVNLNVLVWTNPTPDKTIRRVSVVSEGKAANPTLLGLTLLGGGK